MAIYECRVGAVNKTIYKSDGDYMNILVVKKSNNAVKDRDLFDIYPALDQAWLERKLAMVRTLNTRAFISWEQKPYLFRFSNYRPITGSAEFMYQNVTIMPLPDFTGNVQHIGLLIYDVTDEALGRQIQSNHLTDTPQSIS